jgi:hypothetical protein
MYLNKYGILIKKKLKEKYPEKYLKLQENKLLDKVLNEKQNEVLDLHKNLIKGAKTSLLFKKQLILIQDRITEEINEIVNELGSDIINGL